MEIYCEKVYDLINPVYENKKKVNDLNVRVQPRGIFVENLTNKTVENYSDISHIIELGDKFRTVGFTNMNSKSSRSHSIFTIKLYQTQTDSLIVSKATLVDLGGSEGANSTQAKGKTLQEGSSINKSLTALGKCIYALASTKNKPGHIPYRDSVLTRILEENLGGNSIAAVIATISPANLHYNESLSTLRFANNAKQILCNSVINESENVNLTKQINDLKEENFQLRELDKKSASISPVDQETFNNIENEVYNTSPTDGIRRKESHAINIISSDDIDVEFKFNPLEWE